MKETEKSRKPPKKLVDMAISTLCMLNVRENYYSHHSNATRACADTIIPRSHRQKILPFPFCVRLQIYIPCILLFLIRNDSSQDTPKRMHQKELHQLFRVHVASIDIYNCIAPWTVFFHLFCMLTCVLYKDLQTINHFFKLLSYMLS